MYSDCPRRIYVNNIIYSRNDVSSYPRRLDTSLGKYRVVPVIIRFRGHSEVNVSFTRHQTGLWERLTALRYMTQDAGNADGILYQVDTNTTALVILDG